MGVVAIVVVASGDDMAVVSSFIMISLVVLGDVTEVTEAADVVAVVDVVNADGAGATEAEAVGVEAAATAGVVFGSCCCFRLPLRMDGLSLLDKTEFVVTFPK